MPSNGVVHQLLTGKKRKAHHAHAHTHSSTHTSTHTGASRSADVRTHQSDQNPCNEQGRSSSLSAFLAPPQIYENKNQNRKQRQRQNQKRINHRFVQRNRRIKRHQLEQRRQEYRSGVANRNAGDRDESIDCNDQRRLSENLLVIPQRRRKRSARTENSASPSRANSENDCDNGSSARVLIQTFLEQRHGKRNHSSEVSASSSLSLFEDQTMFPVLILGLCVLASLTKWFDQKQQEELLRKSPIMRDMILWMKRREALHTSYNSAAIARKHRDALIQLAKFHEAIEDSHTTSLNLLSRQHDEEQQQRHNDEQGLQRQNELLVQHREQPNRGAETHPEFGRNLSLSRQVLPSNPNPENYDTGDYHDITTGVDKICKDIIVNNTQENSDDRGRDLYSQAHHVGENTDAVVDPGVGTGMRVEQHQQACTRQISPGLLGRKKNHAKHIQEHQTALNEFVAKSDFKQNRDSTITIFKEAKDVAETATEDGREKNKSEVDSYDEGEKPSLPSSLPSTIHINSDGVMPPPGDDDYGLPMSPIESSITNGRSPKAIHLQSDAENMQEEERLCLPKKYKIEMGSFDRIPGHCTTEVEIEHEMKVCSADWTRHRDNAGDMANHTFPLPPEIEENHPVDSSIIYATPAKMPTGSSDTITKLPVLRRPKHLQRIKTAESRPVRSSVGNEDVGNCENRSFTLESETTTATFKPCQDQEMRYSHTRQPSLGNSKCFPPPNFRPKSKLSNIDSTSAHNPLIEKNYRVGDNLEEYCHNSTSDDVSEILLSQSQRLANPRRITASPQNLPTKNSIDVREHYQHYTNAFSIQNQNTASTYFADTQSNMAAGKQISGRNKSRKMQPLASSKKSWISGSSKRSQSFRQTSLFSTSKGWISNQRARNFLKDASSPKLAVVATATATQSVHHRRENIQNGNSPIRLDSGKAKGQIQIKVCGRDKKSEGTLAPEDTSSEIVEKGIQKEKFVNKTTMSIFPCNSSEPGRQRSESNSAGKGHGIDDTNDIGNNCDTSEDIVDKATEVQNKFKYEETVRGKMAREALNGYECEECAAFFDKAVLHGDGSKYYDRAELLRCSRHRGRHTPPSTPQDYWELSFIDERDERLRKEEAS